MKRPANQTSSAFAEIAGATAKSSGQISVEKSNDHDRARSGVPPDIGSAQSGDEGRHSLGRFPRHVRSFPDCDMITATIR
jgi:hypothetical protein